MASPTAKALREQRVPICKAMRELSDKMHAEKRSDFTPEEQAAWDKGNADDMALLKQIERLEKLESLEKDLGSPIEDRSGKTPPGRQDASGKPDESAHAPEYASAWDRATEEERSLVIQAWCIRQANHPKLKLTARHQETAEKLGVRLDQDLEIPLFRQYGSMQREFRALSGLLPTTGAYLKPEGFVSNLERALLAFGGMRQVASVMRTESGEDLHWPTTNDTTNTGAIIQENVAVGEQDITVGEMILRAYTYTSKLIRVPVSLLQDAAFDLATELGSMLGERIGRINNTHFTTGTGAGQPKGIITAATSGKTTASATAITADEIIDLVHSIDPAYRPGSQFMMHDTILSTVRKLKDGNGNYLWSPGLVAGVPDRLFGYTLVNNQDMASSAASANLTMCFGRLEFYKIRDVNSVRMKRLVERYAEFDQEGFVGFMRTDGNLLNAGTNPVKVLTQAT